jgi:hypothetical protein
MASNAGSDPFDWYANATAIYRATSLDEVLRQMTREQRGRFQRALVEMALWYLEPLSDDAWDCSYRARTLEVAKAFLAAATPEETAAAVATARRIHRDVDGDAVRGEMIDLLQDYSYDLATAVSGEWPLGFVVQRLRRDCAETSGLDQASYEALCSILKRRQVEAAWAIVLNRPPRLARPVAPAEIETALADTAWMYRDGNLAALIRPMSDAQRIRLKQTILREAIAVVEAALTAADGGARASLDAARAWLDRPDAQHLELARALAASSRPDGAARHDQVHAAARHVLAAVAQADVYGAARRTLVALGELHSADPGWDHSDYPSPPPDWEPPPIRERWQIEAALAIRYDREPPRFQLR